MNAIQHIRNAAQSWAVRIFLAFLAICFAFLWGIGDVLQIGGGGAQVVATIGGQKISLQKFSRELSHEMARLQTVTGKAFTQEEAKKAGLYQHVLQKVVQQTLLDLEADALKLTITDAQVREAIRTDPSFHDQTKRFDRVRLKAILQANGVTEKQYTEVIRTAMRRQLLLEGVMGGVVTPKSMTEPLFKWQREQRTVDLVTVYGGDVKGVPVPDDKELQAFYEKHSTAFEIPERRDVSVLLIDAKAAEPLVKISDEEVQEALLAGQSQSEGGPRANQKDAVEAELKAQKVDEQVYTLSTQVEDALAGGATLEEVAKKFTLEIMVFKEVQQGMIDTKTDRQKSLSDDVLKGIIGEAFQNDPGGDIGLSEIGKEGFLAVRVDGVKTKETPPLESVKKKVLDIFLRDKLFRDEQELAQKISEEINAGKSLETAVKGKQFKIERGLTLDRISTDEKERFSQALRMNIFAVELKKAAVGYGQPKETPSLNTRPPLYVAQVQKISTAPAKPGEFEAFHDRVKQVIADDLFGQYILSLEKKYRVEVNQRVFGE